MAGALSELLQDAGSAFTVDQPNRCLTRRVDPILRAAATRAMQSPQTKPPTTCASHGQATYDRHPDPDKAYSEAVKAVEAVAAPLITPNTDRRTLGKAIADLRSQRTHWESTIGDPATEPNNIDRWIGMLELLWQGQSRHAGTSNSRHHTKQEAEAAVHLAVLLVQLTDALHKP